MDVWETLREAAPDDEVSEKSLVAARAGLESEIASERRRRDAAQQRGRKAKRVRWAAGLAGAAAAVAAGAVIATNLLPVAPDDPRVPPIIKPPAASAAEVLHKAGEQTAESGADVLQPGQYLCIEETAAFLQYSIEDAATGVLTPMGNRQNAEAAFVTEHTTRLYVPADREDEWVWDLRDPWRVAGTYGPRAAEAVAEWQRLESGSEGTPELWRLPGGRDPQNPENPDATVDDRALYAEMPRDPQQLLDWYRSRSGATGTEADRLTVWTAASTLSSNLAPADLRAAIFEALALIDGVRITSRDGDLITFEFTAQDGDWTRTTTFTLDTEDARITALTDRSLPAAGSVVPDTVPDEQRTVTVTVVDAAP